MIVSYPLFHHRFGVDSVCHIQSNPALTILTRAWELRCFAALRMRALLSHCDGYLYPLAIKAFMVSVRPAVVHASSSTSRSRQITTGSQRKSQTSYFVDMALPHFQLRSVTGCPRCPTTHASHVIATTSPADGISTTGPADSVASRFRPRRVQSGKGF